MFICLSCACVLLFPLVSLSLLYGFATSLLFLRVAMSSAGGLPLPFNVAEANRGSWTSNASLYRFVWAVKRYCLSSSVLQAVPGRAALAMWLGGMDLRDFGEGESPCAPSGDERMLGRIVLSVKSGWTPKEVLL